MANYRDPPMLGTEVTESVVEFMHKVRKTSSSVSLFEAIVQYHHRPTPDKVLSLTKPSQHTGKKIGDATNGAATAQQKPRRNALIFSRFSRDLPTMVIDVGDDDDG